MNSRIFILGLAAGVGIILLLKSDKGKQMIQGLKDQYGDKLSELSGALKNKVDVADGSLKSGIDKVTNKLAV